MATRKRFDQSCKGEGGGGGGGAGRQASWLWLSGQRLLELSIYERRDRRGGIGSIFRTRPCSSRFLAPCVVWRCDSRGRKGGGTAISCGLQRGSVTSSRMMCLERCRVDSECRVDAPPSLLGPYADVEHMLSSGCGAGGTAEHYGFTSSPAACAGGRGLSLVPICVRGRRGGGETRLSLNSHPSTQIPPWLVEAGEYWLRRCSSA